MPQYRATIVVRKGFATTQIDGTSDQHRRAGVDRRLLSIVDLLELEVQLKDTL